MKDFGEVMEIISNPTPDEPTGIVCEDSATDQKRMLSKWVKEIKKKAIQLNVNAELIDKLPESYFCAGQSLQISTYMRVWLTSRYST